MCNKHEDIFVDLLRKVQLTILSDKLCSKFGIIEEKNHTKMVVNVRKELCGAFINNMNVTYVNYTRENLQRQQFLDNSDEKWDIHFNNKRSHNQFNQSFSVLSFQSWIQRKLKSKSLKKAFSGQIECIISKISKK